MQHHNQDQANFLCDLSEFGLLQISGFEASKFLQGQLTCDVMAVTPTTGCMGAQCNPQGRVISLFYLCMLNECYYLVMQRNMIALTLVALKKYAVFSKVELTDVSDSLMIIGCQQNKISSFVTANTAAIPISPISDCYLIVGVESDVKSAWQQLIDHSELMTSADWKCRNIHNGIPTIYPETSGKFLPHEINLPLLHAVSFEKGCYTGQEIIARMHYRGKLKNHLYRASISSKLSPLPGADVYTRNEHETYACGSIVDVCTASVGHYQVLLVLDDKNANNTPLFMKDEKDCFTLLKN